MTGLPEVTIAGTLTADPELRFTAVSREFAISEGLSAGNRRGEGL